MVNGELGVAEEIWSDLTKELGVIDAGETWMD
jgi:hypothetical protein